MHSGFRYPAPLRPRAGAQGQAQVPALQEELQELRLGGAMAQLVARLAGSQQVRGSNPRGSTAEEHGAFTNSRSSDQHPRWPPGRGDDGTTATLRLGRNVSAGPRHRAAQGPTG